MNGELMRKGRYFVVEDGRWFRVCEDTTDGVKCRYLCTTGEAAMRRLAELSSGPG